MRSSKLRAVLMVGLGAVLAAGAMVAWPVGCSHPGTRAADGAAVSGFTAQPRFAYADEAPRRFASLADVAAAALPAVVNISSTRVVHQTAAQNPFFNDPFFRRFFGQVPNQPQQEQRMQALGSGVIVSPDGIVVTNNHVIEKATTIKVTTSDRREFEAKVVGADPQSDIAVLRLKGNVHDLKVLPFGNSSELRLGDVVLAIGDPFGVGETVTMGIVSAKGRANVGIEDYEDFIQTDAAINPGNSGGALVNMQGQLVGINTAILSRSGGYQGIGFAIPSNMVRPIMESLLKTGKVVRGWLGVVIQNLTPDLAKGLKLPSDNGVLVSDVQANSPAAKAGLKRGDVVLNIAGEKVNSTGQLRNLVASHGAHVRVKLDILRNGKPMTVSVMLGELPTTVARNAQVQEQQGALGGVTVGNLDAAARSKYNISDQVKHGVVVVSVNQGSAAADAGLQPGDVILELNRAPLMSVDQFQKQYRASEHRALLLVYRDGTTMFMVLSK